MPGFVPESSGNLDPANTAEGRVDDLPRGNFMLFVHPQDWQLDARGKLIPVIVQVGKEVGNGSVSTRGDFAQHRLEHEKNGFVPIPHEFLGSEIGDYVVPWRNKLGRKVHATIFQIPSDGPDGKTVWPVDMQEYWKFLDLLRARGIVKQPSVRVVKGILSQKMTLYADKEKRGPRNTTAEAIDRYDREMQALREVISNLEIELEESVRVYGAEVSSVRGKLGPMLERELEQARKVQAATAGLNLPRQRGPRTPKAPVPEKPSDLIADPDDDE